MQPDGNLVYTLTHCVCCVQQSRRFASAAVITRVIRIRCIGVRCRCLIARGGRTRCNPDHRAGDGGAPRVVRRAVVTPGAVVIYRCRRVIARIGIAVIGTVVSRRSIGTGVCGIAGTLGVIGAAAIGIGRRCSLAIGVGGIVSPSFEKSVCPDPSSCEAVPP